VVLTLLNSALYVIDQSRATATVTITDSGAPLPMPTVTIRATDPDASEAGDNGEFTFERTGDSGTPLTVFYSTQGSAAPGADYVSLSGTVSFGTGLTLVTVTVIPVVDTVSENDEDVIATLVPGAGYTIGSPGSATVTISNRDAGPEISGPGSGAGAASIPLSLTLGSPASQPLQGTWRYEFTPDPTVPGSQNRDDQIVLSTTSFSISAGATEASPPLTVTLGSVAGTVSVFAELTGGAVVDHQIEIEPGPPRVTGIEIVTRSYGYDVVVFGFSSRLDVATARFVFGGTNIEQPGPIDVGPYFEAWFGNPASLIDGTTFEYTQPFNVDGNRTTLTSVTVTLIEENGTTSVPMSVPIP
jgi:hypothetical protein